MIDVIVPIYNGYEETKECLQALIDKRNNMDFRIFLINDNSPNEKIVNLLSKVDNNIFKIINNSNNLGFVKSVNKGMRLSSNDVILLNSDTIVTNNWIDKLYSAAYSDPNIGTVTSLTNNGTIASVPYFNIDNNIPSGYTIDGFASLVEKLSEKIYPNLPTAVGHCMYIKRDTINKVGYFDEETFGMGYGEEEDFSNRVRKVGLRNILADDTFIFHYGSTSFKEEKIKLIQQNKKILRKKYWTYPFKVKIFIYFNRSIKVICKNIQNQLVN